MSGVEISGGPRLQFFQNNSLGSNADFPPGSLCFSICANHRLKETFYCLWMILLIYYKIPTVLHYRWYQKKSECKHFITRLHIEENEPEMFTANKIFENTGPEKIFSGFKQNLKKYEISKIQSWAAIPSNKKSIWCGLIYKLC